MQMAFHSLKNNKFRCFLTMLGIIIGVSSVITMLAIGQGSKRSIQAQISEMGSNVIMVFPGNRRAGGVRLSADEMQTLKLQDYRSIQEKATLLSHVSPMVSSSGQFIYGAKNTPSTLYGEPRIRPPRFTGCLRIIWRSACWKWKEGKCLPRRI